MENILVTIFFYLIAFVCLVGAMGVVFNKQIVNSALMLLMTFLGVAGLFVLLNSDFVAMAQIMVYSVGIAIIIIFAIMLTDPNAKQEPIYKRPRAFISLATCFILLCFLFAATISGYNSFLRIAPAKETIKELAEKGSTGIIGQTLFSNYVLPFEIISVLLLVAIVGAVLLARRKAEALNEE